MTGYEHETKEVVADVIVERGIEIRHGHLLLRLELASQLLLSALEPRVSAEEVDCRVLRSGHEPGAGVVRDARFRPLLKRSDEGVLRELLGKTDIAHDPRETGDDPGRLDPPDCVDGAMCVGSRHGYPSHHLQSARASPGARRGHVRGHPHARELLRFGTAVFGLVHLANFGLTLPAGPMYFVKFHEARRRFDRFFFRLQLKLRIPADNLLGLGKGPVCYIELPPGKPDAGSRSSWEEYLVAEHRAGFGRVLAELPNGVH